jgi:hypothetical protein
MAYTIIAYREPTWQEIQEARYINNIPAQYDAIRTDNGQWVFANLTEVVSWNPVYVGLSPAQQSAFLRRVPNVMGVRLVMQLVPVYGDDGVAPPLTPTPPTPLPAPTTPPPIFLPPTLPPSDTTPSIPDTGTLPVIPAPTPTPIPTPTPTPIPTPTPTPTGSVDLVTQITVSKQVIDRTYQKDSMKPIDPESLTFGNISTTIPIRVTCSPANGIVFTPSTFDLQPGQQLNVALTFDIPKINTYVEGTWTISSALQLTALNS